MQDCDFIIRGGTIIDGTGREGYRGDLAVSGDRIVAVGDASGCRAQAEMDAIGLVIAPGFIDVHTHDDAALFKTPDMAFKVSQGVTTVIAGNCGVSAAPFRLRDDLPAPFTLGIFDDATAFGEVAQYRAAFDQKPAAVNVALLCGHSCLRPTRWGRICTGPPVTMKSQRWPPRLI